LADHVYADAPSSLSDGSLEDSNIQNSEYALTAHVFSKTSPIEAKNDPKSVVDSDSRIVIDENNTALVSTLGTGMEDADNDGSDSDQISFYTVKAGDTWSGIADMYGVTVNTVLWANDKTKSDKLVVGEVLLIPPISGLEHEVKSGQTCQSIAAMYKVDAYSIADYNGLGLGCKLTVGDTIFIPNGEKSAVATKPVQKTGSTGTSKITDQYTKPTKALSGYFINPVPGYRLSQGIHDKNAVDLAIPTGTPIHAAASGRVLLARNGYNGGFGNVVIISHPNGTETLYAHQSRIATTTGAQVKQGQVIGYVGSTGHSTGPHLHFEVHGAKNPGANGSWAH
jgi:LysM repeat protein